MFGFIKNSIRSLFFFTPFERVLAGFTQNKTLDNFFVKLLPLNSSYTKNYLRTKNIDGINYQLDLRQWMEYVFYFGINVDHKESMYQHIKPGMNVLDVGANFGETLLNFARRSAPGKAIGFEPVPYIYEKCRKNISLNNFENVKLEQLALSNTNEWLAINDPYNNNSGGVFLTREKSATQVKAISLDEYLDENNFDKIEMIKIDVEGFEMNVILGAEKTLKQYYPILIIEVIDVNLKKQNTSAVELITVLKNWGYNHISDLATGEMFQLSNTEIYADLVFAKN